ncbi:MAG: hypothetical protein HY074_19505 [Deltaproteobacteria bacterium]|nr:hypothetical protein [Deltaproteobacteria bacterium]
MIRTVSLIAVLFLTMSAASQTRAFAEDRDMNGAPAHLHLDKGAAHSASGSTSSNPLLLYKGGAVLHSSTTMAIFWGTQWNTPSFAGDKINGIDLFFSGMNASEYASTALEYGDTTGSITSSSLYLGHVIDATAAPNRALSTSSAVAEACKVVGNNPNPSALYLIYTATGAGHVNYCAWHSWGTCSNGAPIQVAYMPNLDGLAGCDPQDAVTGHSQGLAALANVTAHELLETITDPRGTGWVDSSGNENGDKCAWSFPITTSNPYGLSTLSNGTTWKLQMEWSNAAYTAGTGLPNRSSQLGCIY